MNQVVDEFLSAMNGLDDRSRRWLLTQGVPPGIIEVSPGPVTVASIETDPLGCFQFTQFGKAAFVHPVTVGPDIVDLVAWFPSDPARWWTHVYSGVPLGDEHLFFAKYWQKPVTLRATPLDWLRADGDGTCILDWKMSAPALRAVPELICETVEHGEEAFGCLSAPTLPVPAITILEKDPA